MSSGNHLLIAEFGIVRKGPRNAIILYGTVNYLVTYGKTALVGGTVITPFETLERGVVVINGERIARIGTTGQVEIPSDAEVIDVSGCYVTPGFIDLHAHGALGANVMDGTEGSLRKISRFFAEHGVTSFLATTLTAPHERLKEVVRVIAEFMGKERAGAEVLGIHLEGPWINVEKAGSQPSEWVRPPSVEEFKELYQISGGAVKVVTLAPELPGALKLITEARKLGVVASMGHTLAAYEDVVRACSCGLSHVTHVFNTMGPFHHRSPGAVGASLALDELTVEIIADGVHVHPAAVKVVVRAKGVDKVCLVTDSTSFTGLEPGEYEVSRNLRVIVERNACWLPDGRLFGSVLTMERAVENIIKFANVSLQDAIKMASWNPARVIGIHSERGSLEPGKYADIVVLGERMDVVMTFVRGVRVFSRE